MKNLVITAAGRGSLHSIWLDAKERNFDVIVIHYEGYEAEQENTFEKVGNVIHYYKKGFKWQLIKDCYDAMVFKNKYDYYLFPDDDVLIHADQINKLFSIAEQFKLTVFHPSIEELNYWHDVMFKKENSILRYTGWIETQCAGMSKEAFTRLSPYFSENKSSYGYPNLWHKLYDYDRHTFAVVDEVTSIHSRGLQSGSNNIYDMLPGTGDPIGKAMDEMTELFKKHDLKDGERFQEKVYKRPLLSIACIFSSKDRDYLPEQEKTLPDFAQKIYLQIKPFIEGAGYPAEEIIKVQRGEKTVFAELYTKETNFALWRNAALSLCDGDFVLFLDADERLLTHQNDQYLETIEKLYANPKIGGVIYNIISCYKDANEGQFTCKPNTMVRLIRNHKGLYWTGKAHETPEMSIFEKGFHTIQSTFKIDHLGYESPKGDMRDKMKRNIIAILSDQEALKHDYYKNILVRDCVNLANLTEGDMKWL